MQIFEAVQENKPFILNVYRCVHRERVEKYLQPLVDQLLLDVIDEEAAGMTLRDEDKQFIAKVYAYIFFGVMLDWIKNDMRENPQEIVSRLGESCCEAPSAAISRFPVIKGTLHKTTVNTSQERLATLCGIALILFFAFLIEFFTLFGSVIVFITEPF